MKRGVAPDDGAKLVETARDVRRKAAFLLRKPFIEQREVYALAKHFFKAYLRKDCEYTCEELSRELHKVYLSTAIRERVEGLIEKLSLLEYTDTLYSQAELRILLQDLEMIVKQLVSEHQRARPLLTRIADVLFGKRPKPRVTVITEFPAIEPNDPVTIEMNTLLEEVYLALDENKVRRAAKTYRGLHAKYSRLGKTAQQAHYHKLSAAYEAIMKQAK